MDIVAGYLIAAREINARRGRNGCEKCPYIVGRNKMRTVEGGTVEIYSQGGGEELIEMLLLIWI